MLSEYIKHGEFEFAGVNPCAEEPLPAGGSCLIGAINLSEYVIDAFGDKPAFDIPSFRQDVRTCITALNDVLDEGLELHPLQIQRDCVREWRQIGLGIMGFADMLIKMGITYGSERCINLIDQIGNAMVIAGLDASSLLAMIKEPFKNFDADRILESQFIENFDLPASLKDRIKKYGLRNSQLFTIAPTGSISTMLGVSGGVEPIFDISYTRTTKSLEGEDKDFIVYTPIVAECMKAKNTEDIPAEITWSKVINPYDRIAVQGAWQGFIDASISSTVNLPVQVDVDTVMDLYIFAWEQGCKGLTIFREGCKRVGILNSNPPKKQEEPQEVPNVEWDDMHLDDTDTDIANCVAKGCKLQTGCGSLWMTAYFHKQTGQLCHVFLDKGSQGGCLSNMNAVSRLISGWSKDGAPLEKIIDQLESVTACPSYAVAKATKSDISKGKCCPSAVGKALKKLHEQFMVEEYLSVEPIDYGITTEEAVENLKENTQAIFTVETPKTMCPICGAFLIQTGGCNVCRECGWSKCD